MQSLRIIEESTGNGDKESNHMLIVLAHVANYAFTLKKEKENLA